MSVFDEPNRLLAQDLDELEQRLQRLIYMLNFDPSVDAQHRLYHEVSRATLSQVIDDFGRALGDKG